MAKKNAKYPYDYVGFYDTETRQCIDISKKREDIEKILGKGKENGNDFYTKYSNNLSIGYDKNENVYCMKLTNASDTISQYELPGGINLNSTVTEFIDLYPFIYEESGNQNDVGIFIKETSGKYSVINKNTLRQSLKSISEKENESNLYWIQLSYSSYSEIDYISIYALNSS